jgi:predicted GNAT family acetyltransferase
VRFAVLTPGDEEALERFLLAHADTSMFLRSNSRSAGLVDHGESMQGTYAAAWNGDEIVAVAAHFWNGMVALQVPDPSYLDVVRIAVERSRRAVGGLAGPWTQLVAARSHLGMDAAATRLNSREDLFTLALDQLQMPVPQGICRAPAADEIDLLVAWRATHHVDAFGATPGPEVDALARREIEGNRFKRVLVVDDEPCSYATFNARLPDIVQVGGVYTPAPLRCRGYARALVASLLDEARNDGATRAILFTGADNVAARRAYLALGFTIVGDYGLVFFA